MIPLLIGAGLSYAADLDAQARRQKLLNAMRGYQHGQSEIGQAATQQYLAGVTPEARAAELSNLTADRSKTLQDSVASVQASNASPIAGKLSPDFQRAQEAAANTVAERTRKAIAQMSTMGSPGEQGVQSGIRFGRAAGTVDATNSAINRVGNTYTAGINSVQPSPMLKLGGKALMAYGAAGGDFGEGTKTGFAGAQIPDSSETDGGPMPTWSARLSKSLGVFRKGWGS